MPSIRITATAVAREAIRHLSDSRGAPVMFVQSGGCCAGRTPVCYPENEFLVGPGDVLLPSGRAWRALRHSLRQLCT